MRDIPEKEVSGLGDLSFSFSVKDDDGTAVTTGTGRVIFCAVGTTDYLGTEGNSVFTADHVAAGVWRARIDETALDILPAVGGRFDVDAQIVGRDRVLIARCRRVVKNDARPSLG